MTIDNLVNSMYTANVRIASSIDELDEEDKRVLESSPEYNANKAKAAAGFLNNFYFRLPGGWLMELVSEEMELRENIGEEVIFSNKQQMTYKQMFNDVRESLLDADLSLEECTKIADLKPREQREYVFEEQNFYRLIPIMLEAYIALRKRGYKKQELIS